MDTQIQNKWYERMIMKSATIKDAEITIAGLTFIVDYHYYVGSPATFIYPTEPASIDILSVTVKGQLEADADSLLTAIKFNVRQGLLGKPQFADGYDLLEQHILENPPEL
jgi:hypothetical protein